MLVVTEFALSLGADDCRGPSAAQFLGVVQGAAGLQSAARYGGSAVVACAE